MSVTLDTKVLDGILANLDYKAADAVRDTALAVQGKAAMNAPYDTGALSASITAEEETPTSWRVRDGVLYGLYNEVGTSRMAAHPFMVPAVEGERSSFEQRLARVVVP